MRTRLQRQRGRKPALRLVARRGSSGELGRGWSVSSRPVRAPVQRKISLELPIRKRQNREAGGYVRLLESCPTRPSRPDTHPRLPRLPRRSPHHRPPQLAQVPPPPIDGGQTGPKQSSTCSLSTRAGWTSIGVYCLAEGRWVKVRRGSSLRGSLSEGARPAGERVDSVRRSLISGC